MSDLGVVAGALIVGLGAEIADPLGLAITRVTLEITCDSWRTGATRTRLTAMQ